MWQRVLLVAALGLGVPARAQPAGPSTVLETPNGIVEFLGLHDWTVEALTDSMRIRAGYDLMTQGAHACGAVLRYQLHFPDAAVMAVGGRAGSPYWLVTVTEPQDSARVRYRVMPLDTTGGRSTWRDVRRIVRAHRSALSDYLSTALTRGSGDRQWHGKTVADSVALDTLRSFFAVRDGERDERDAIDVLHADSDMYDREIAVAVLIAFGHDDAAWVALSDALLESDGLVKASAADALSAMVAAGERPRDWTALAPAIHAVLDGTSQFMMPAVLQLLNRVPLDTSLARPFLKGGGSMLLAYAGAAIPLVHDPARQLLRTLSRRDYGGDIARWHAWVVSL